MLPKEMLHKEIDALPEEFTEDLYNFVTYLKRKRLKETIESALLGRVSPKRRDWLSATKDDE